MFNSPQRMGQNEKARKRKIWKNNSGLDYKTGGRGQQGKEDTEKNGVHTTVRKHIVNPKTDATLNKRNRYNFSILEVTLRSW
jgi:ribosomal protein L15